MPERLETARRRRAARMLTTIAALVALRAPAAAASAPAATPAPAATAAPTTQPSPIATHAPIAAPAPATPRPVATVATMPLTETGRVPVTGHPFASAFSADGSALFVSIDVDFGGGIAVLTRTAGKYAFSRFVALHGTPGGMALTSDGSTLVVTTGSGLALLDAKALAGSDDPNVRPIEDSANDGSIDVVIAPNGYAYFTSENTGTVAVADLHARKIVSHVTTDSGPVGIALTPDGRSLFVTSEVASAAVSTRTCPALRGAVVREGTLDLIDVAAAIADPAKAIRARAAAGCSPSRVVVSPAGDVAWVSARDDDDILAFDAAHFATLAANVPFSVPVGNAPIGLAMLRRGHVLAVANSNRYAEDVTVSTLSLIDTAGAFVNGHGTIASVATGGFPRDLATSRDGSKLALTNYRTNDVQVFDVTP